MLQRTRAIEPRHLPHIILDLAEASPTRSMTVAYRGEERRTATLIRLLPRGCRKHVFQGNFTSYLISFNVGGFPEIDGLIGIHVRRNSLENWTLATRRGSRPGRVPETGAISWHRSPMQVDGVVKAFELPETPTDAMQFVPDSIIPGAGRAV